MTDDGQNRTAPRARAPRPPRWQQAFLTALAASGNVRLACDAADVARSVVYDRRAAVPAFAAAWQQALDDAADILEAEARRRALEGWDEPVYGRIAKDTDGQIGVVHKYSDALMALLLKGAKPETYRERQDVTSRGTQLQINWDQVPDDLRDAFIDRRMTLDDVLRELQRRPAGA